MIIGPAVFHQDPMASRCLLGLRLVRQRPHRTVQATEIAYPGDHASGDDDAAGHHSDSSTGPQGRVDADPEVQGVVDADGPYGEADHDP